MHLSEYIINDIKPLATSDKISDLQLLFNQSTYTHIPIKNKDNHYIGSLSETDVYCFEIEKPIADYMHASEGFFVREEANWLDVLETFAESSSNIMPVLNAKNVYLGYYELNDIISLFNQTPFFAEAGGTIIIEKGIHEYSFSEISQIIESNGGKIFGAFISKMDNDCVQLTLKIGNSSINDIIQTFRRYNYNIISGHEEDSYMEKLKDRSDYLNRYLNI